MCRPAVGGVVVSVVAVLSQGCGGPRVTTPVFVTGLVGGAVGCYYPERHAVYVYDLKNGECTGNAPA